MGLTLLVWFRWIWPSKIKQTPIIFIIFRFSQLIFEKNKIKLRCRSRWDDKESPIKGLEDSLRVLGFITYLRKNQTSKNGTYRFPITHNVTHFMTTAFAVTWCDQFWLNLHFMIFPQCCVRNLIFIYDFFFLCILFSILLKKQIYNLYCTSLI